MDSNVRGYLRLVFITLALLLLAAPMVSLADEGDTPEEAWARLQEASGEQVQWIRSQATGTASFVRATFGATLPVTGFHPTAVGKASAFLTDYGALFGISDPQRQLKLVDVDKESFGLQTIRYQQVHQGIPVYGATLAANFNQQGLLTSVNGRFLPDLTLAAAPSLDFAQAQSAALNAVAKGASAEDMRADGGELVVFHPGLVQDVPATVRLAYLFMVTNGTAVRQFVFVDAETGVVLLKAEGIHHDLSRSTYTMNNQTDYALAELCRDEGDGPTGDVDCDNAHDYAGDTYNYLFNAFGRDSLDNAGLDLISFVHYGDDYFNAFWNGYFMTYGDGFAAADDVVGHELAHGVTEYTANMIYMYQPGALNESYSDIIGETVDLLNGSGNDAPELRWKMGEDLIFDGEPYIIRDMSDPNLFGDPDATDDALYYCGAQDYGGVHWNSGVPNKLYSLLVDGGRHQFIDVDGIGLTKAGAIHYRALEAYHGIFSNFTDHEQALLASCLDLVGLDLPDPLTGEASGETITATDCEGVYWAAQAVNLSGPVCEQVANPAPPQLCGTGETPIFFYNDDQDVDRGWQTANGGGGFVDWISLSDPFSDRGTVWALPPAGNDYCEEDLDASDSAMLTSPAIKVPETAEAVLINIDQYFFIENNWDAGMLEYSTDGVNFTRITPGRFLFNGYNDGVYPATFGNTNPLADGEFFLGAFTGFNNPGQFPDPSYLTTRVDLTGLVMPGDTVHLRFHYGQDFCGFYTDIAWLVDTVQAYTCAPTGDFTLGVEGPDTGLVATPYAFTATVDMDAAALQSIDQVSPVMYTWEATDQEPIQRPGGLSDMVTYTWSTPGHKEITVTATSAAGMATVMHAIEITPQMLELPLMADTWLDYNQSTISRNLYQSLVVFANGQDRILLTFDASTLPEGADVVDAALTLHATLETGAVGKQLTALNVDPFDPELVTYADGALLNYFNPSPSIPVSFDSLATTVNGAAYLGPLTLDVTGNVSAWLDDATTGLASEGGIGQLAVALTSPFSGRVAFFSLESFGYQQYAPKLVVTFVP